MRQVNILEVPSCCLSGITADRLTEKRQFESVAMAVCGFQIPCVVPPLCLEVGMIEIVSREFEAIARHRGAVLCGEGAEKKERHCEGCQPTLHGQPQAD